MKPQMNTNLPTGDDLWRSLDEVADTEEFQRFLAKEFPTQAAELLAGPSRRQFLKVMGASLALAGMGGLTGCIRWPEQNVLPFAHRPEGRIPGVPSYYATGYERDGVGQGILATSFDGRPIKVDGNPEHPSSLGSLDLIGQATVLGLYDPARSREVVSGGHSSTWSAARDALVAAARAGGFAVLSGPTSSPTIRRVRDRLLAEVPGARWFEYCPLSRDSEREGTQLIFGAPHRPIYDFAAAQVVLILDADPLMTHPAALMHSRGFAAARVARRESGAHHRMFAVESVHSITGSVADQRFPVAQSEIVNFAARVAAALNLSGIPSDLMSGLQSAGEPMADHRLIAEELNAHRGACLVVAGDRQPAEVHALAHLMNVSLGSVGKTVRYAPEFDPDRASHADQIEALVSEMNSGRIQSVLILGGNPVFDAPGDLDFAGALAKVRNRFRLGDHQDETSQGCSWHLPEAHYLETWLDTRAWDGPVTITQPLIEPLFGGRNAAEVVGMILDEHPSSAYDLVKQTFAALSGNRESEPVWRETVHRGFLAGSEFPSVSPGNARGGWGSALADRIASARASEFEIVFTGDHSLYDGRFANNGWLQECPDPMTKIAWDNAAIIAPADATRLGVKTGDLVRVSVDDKNIEIVAFVMPGQAARSVTIPVGYGREVFDRVAGGVSYNLAKGTGVDVYPLRSLAALRNGSVSGTLEKTGGRAKLATTQNHWAIGTLQQEETEMRVKEFARVVDLSDYRAHGAEAVAALAPHVPHRESLWDELPFGGHRWGMSIDLDLCIGCSACVVACQSENNIAVTGKDEVAYGREMHWIRIDRYFRGEDYDNPEVVHQPLTCHHCENAPCEQVCPVAATTHSAEGLNDMVYNRCIGTRYCSNNCPYKVRRFNYFNNAKHPSETEKMLYNPEVTIRNRGVMEKCTFCVQRINRTKISAKNDGRAVRDGEIVPACAQTCPTQAITFGDLADHDSVVSKEQASDRAYAMLEQINVKPRTRYLARVVNPPREGSTH